MICLVRFFPLGKQACIWRPNKQRWFGVNDSPSLGQGYPDNPLLGKPKPFSPMERNRKSFRILLPGTFCKAIWNVPETQISRKDVKKMRKKEAFEEPGLNNVVVASALSSVCHPLPLFVFGKMLHFKSNKYVFCITDNWMQPFEIAHKHFQNFGLLGQKKHWFSQLFIKLPSLCL